MSTEHTWSKTADEHVKIEAHLKCKVNLGASALDRRRTCRANSLAWLIFSPRPLGTPALELPSCYSKRCTYEGVCNLHTYLEK